MKSLALLLLRLTTGSLLAGHGAQKLFGSFDGPGIEGAHGMVESLGFRPARPWAVAAGASEFVGGVLTALGFLSPIGPIAAASSMAIATGTVHRDKPVWVTAGGAELPITNMAILGALTLAGPGALSMDRLFGSELGWGSKMLFLTAAGGLVGYGLWHSSRNQAEAQAQKAASSGQRPASETATQDRIRETVDPGSTAPDFPSTTE